jgi:hypothetical protein
VPSWQIAARCRDTRRKMSTFFIFFNLTVTGVTGPAQVSQYGAAYSGGFQSAFSIKQK